MIKALGIKKTALAVVAVALLLGIATSPFVTIFVIQQHATQIVEDTFIGLTASGTANADITEAFLETSRALTAGSAAELQACKDRIAKATASTDERLKRYEISINGPEDRRNYDDLVQKRTSYRETRSRVLELVAKGDKDAAARLFNSECLPRFHSYLQALGRVIEFNAAEAAERGAQILSRCNTFLIVEGVLVLFFLVYAFFVPLVTLMERLTRKSLED